MNWNNMVIVLSILLAAFAVWREYARANKRHLIFRVAAALTTIIALACIALPLTYNGAATLSAYHDAILLTGGFNKDSLGKNTAQKIFTPDKSIQRVYPKAKLISGLDELTADSSITRLQVYGYGLNDDELMQLNQLPIVFHPSATPGGITAINWDQKIKSGDALRIQGTFKNTSTKKVKLILKGLNTNLDSAFINGNITTEFELRSVPKNSGRAVYNLMAIAGADTLENESLPLIIEPARPLNVLILPTSPDFETKFLKNWLAENGYGVAVRSAISKGKFNRETINMQQFPLDNITNGVFSKFDVVIGDLSALKTLSPAENSALKQEVAQKGLGLIIRADSSGKSTSWLQDSFQVMHSSAKNPPTLSLNIPSKKAKTAKVNTGGMYINYPPGTQSLALDEQGHVVAGSILTGSGKVVYTTLNNTFNWMLAGDKNDYATLWALLISKAARKLPVTEKWNMITPVPVINAPVQLQLESGAAPSVITIGSFVIAPLQNPSIPFEWTSLYWPKETGWQQVKQNNGNFIWWYAYSNSAWKNIVAVNNSLATINYADKSTGVNDVTKQIHQKVRIPVPKLYFYILLLLACTFLWIEGKMTATNYFNKQI
ncbi:hypothetical protein BH09BAC6_BH09BAC6_03260 [soil metagenome]